VVGERHVCRCKNAVYRDLKPENILANGTEGGGGRLVIADFGMARTFLTALTGEVCSLWYAHIEALVPSRAYNASMDVWTP
jgi:serine/threonine protein kinase